MARIAVAALATGAAALRPTLPVTPARARGRVATKMVIDPSHAHDLMTAHVGHDWGSTFQMAAIQGRTCVDDTGWWCTTAWKSKFYGAFGASTAASSPRNDLVENFRVHPTHWLISTQPRAARRRAAS